MTHHKDYKNESQDARRHDQQHAVHPSKNKESSEQKHDKNQQNKHQHKK